MTIAVAPNVKYCFEATGEKGFINLVTTSSGFAWSCLVATAACALSGSGEFVSKQKPALLLTFPITFR